MKRLYNNEKTASQKIEELFNKHGCGRDLRGLFPLVQGQNNTGVELLFEEESIKHFKTVLPVLPDGTYHNYELFASFRGQRYNVSDMTFDTDYQVLILEGIKIIGIAIYTHTESAELLFDHIIYPQMECVLFNENEVFNMKDWFCGTSVFDISARKYWAGSQTKNYITSIFTLNQKQLVAFDLKNGGTIQMDSADNSTSGGSTSEADKDKDNKYHILKTNQGTVSGYFDDVEALVDQPALYEGKYIDQYGEEEIIEKGVINEIYAKSSTERKNKNK